MQNNVGLFHSIFKPLPKKSALPFPNILLFSHCENLVYAHTLGYLDWLSSHINTLDFRYGTIFNPHSLELKQREW